MTMSFRTCLCHLSRVEMMAGLKQGRCRYQWNKS